MTTKSLARSYLDKAEVRVEVLELLLRKQAYSDVVREAQELVELALKGVLRQLGLDPPKWHDVGPFLAEQAHLLPEDLRSDVPQLAEISRWLRRERELAFYGDIDFVPTEEYGPEEARRAMEGARFVLDRARRLILPP